MNDKKRNARSFAIKVATPPDPLSVARGSFFLGIGTA